MPAPGPAAIRRALLGWYAAGHRDFSFRRTRDPYAVLVSETMLQQTQASRVDARLGPFLARFPTAGALAAASEGEVLAAWSGLGYNRRALSLRRAAPELEPCLRHATRERRVPSVAELERLPGVGPYTARAVVSLAFGVPVGVVDTNVRRWLTRRWGLPANPPARWLQAIADSLATSGRRSSDDAGAWTHASMEFGAAVCTARRPRCGECPIARGCPSRDRAETVAPRRSISGDSARRRAHRGALLRAIAESPGRRLRLADARTRLRELTADDAERLITGLERDGLLHRANGRLVLGGG